MRALQTRRWTREEYDQLIEHGVVREGERIELIEGEIIPKMTQHVPHVVGFSLAEDALRSAFGLGFYVRTAQPLIAGDDSEPEPDLAVVPGSPRDYAKARTHPMFALLVVEISDSSLGFDRRQKARVYARASFPEYWIINLQDRVVEVHRDPQVPEGRPSSARYATIVVYREGDMIVPLHAPSARVAVSDLLP